MRINKKTYEGLIKGDIKVVNKHLPNSLEKSHIIAVLKCSVKLNYPESSNSKP